MFSGNREEEDVVPSLLQRLMRFIGTYERVGYYSAEVSDFAQLLPPPLRKGAMSYRVTLVGIEYLKDYLIRGHEYVAQLEAMELINGYAV